MSRGRWSLVFVVLALGTAPSLAAQPGPPEDLFRGPERGRVEREIERLAEIQGRHQDALLSLPKVHGVGISVDPVTRDLVFLVAVEREGLAPALPLEIEGVRVVIERSDPPAALNGGGACVPCHSDQVALPVPMGNSTSNANLCFACTLGFKACRDGVIYYVTNAHCSPDAFGCEGKAAIGSNTYHRARLDAGCAVMTDIGDVSVHATPRCGSNNYVDAARMLSSNSLTSWAIRDIGTPSTAWKTAVVGDAVQKSGRTTGLTYGTVSAVSYATNVGGYCCGSPRFVNQIRVNASAAPFIQGGDSGSALLDRSYPPRITGLLFAGPADGSYGIANHITYVLATLGNLTLDPNCQPPTCEDECYWYYDDCLETFCYWDYDEYMCNEGCYLQYQDCLSYC